MLGIWSPCLTRCTSDVGTNLPQEAHSPLLAAAVIISSYLVTEDRTIEDDIIGGNWSEAATRDSYSSRMKFKARTKASCAESGLGMILCLFTFGDKGRERGSPILFCERSLGAMTDGWA
jgi:hypothetical protein